MSSFYLVRPAGFEPTTPWFVAKYSIQLSYGRYVKPKIIYTLTEIGSPSLHFDEISR